MQAARSAARSAAGCAARYAAETAARSAAKSAAAAACRVVSATATDLAADRDRWRAVVDAAAEVDVLRAFAERTGPDAKTPPGCAFVRPAFLREDEDVSPRDPEDARLDAGRTSSTEASRRLVERGGDLGEGERAAPLGEVGRGVAAEHLHPPICPASRGKTPLEEDWSSRLTRLAAEESGHAQARHRRNS